MGAVASATDGVDDTVKQQQAALMLRQLLLQQQGANQQVSKKARELYVGNLQLGMVNESTLMELFNGSLGAVFQNQTSQPCLQVTMSSDQKFAFVEFASPELANAGLNLNGLMLHGRPLRVGRPQGYVGPPSETGAPTELGPPSTLGSAGLAGMGGMGGMGAGLGNPPLGMPGMPAGLGSAGMGAPAQAGTTFLCLENLVQPSDLVEDADYSEIMEDVQEECAKFGAVDKIVIPRPKAGSDPPGVGKAYIRFISLDGSTKAQQSLNGRHFGDNKVVATFISDSDFAAVSAAN